MRRRVLTVIGCLYTAQFIPFSFANMSLPIILRQEGYTAANIGLVQLAALPYIFKFLWAPLIDRYRFGAEHYKSWVLLLSLLHVIGIVALAFTDPAGNVLPLFLALLLAALAVSTQDVAVDAFTISVLKPQERTLGSTFQNAGLYAGAIIGGFGFMSLYAYLGWKVALLAQAGIFVLPLFALFLIQEPDGGEKSPDTGVVTAMLFFTQDKIGGWLVILAIIRVPLVLSLIPIRLMMVDQDMGTQEIALWFGLLSMCAGGGATVILGPALRKLPANRAIFLVALLNIPILILTAIVGTQFPYAIKYAIIVVWTTIAIMDVVMFRCAMDRVRSGTPGFDFSVQIAIYFVLAGLLDPVVGLLIDEQGYLPAFLVTLPLALVPFGLIFFRRVSISQPLDPN